MIGDFLKHFILEACIENISNRLITNFSDHKLKGVAVFSLEHPVVALCMGIDIKYKIGNYNQPYAIRMEGCSSNWIYKDDWYYCDSDQVSEIKGSITELKWVELEGTIKEVMQQCMDILDVDFG